jgi:hypothetical protein
MKTISAITSWANGQATEAKLLNAYVINDNLVSSATFYYALLSENEDGTIGEGVAQGNLTMTGEPYTTWQTNGQAWSYVATTLGLTITGDYVPPVPPVVETTTEPNNSSI